MENKIMMVKIIFNYAYMNNINNYLPNKNILRKTFDNNNVTYLIVINNDDIENIIYKLNQITNNQIKIYLLDNNDEDYEVGTDKPIGSKSAIDEN